MSHRSLAVPHKSFIDHLGISSENHVGDAATDQLDDLRYVIFLKGVECVANVTVEVLISAVPNFITDSNLHSHSDFYMTK